MHVKKCGGFSRNAFRQTLLVDPFFCGEVLAGVTCVRAPVARPSEARAGVDRVPRAGA